MNCNICNGLEWTLLTSVNFHMVVTLSDSKYGMCLTLSTFAR